MELLGQTKTGAYTFQSTINQKRDSLVKDFATSQKLSEDQYLNGNHVSPFLRAPVSAVGTTCGRYNSTQNYHDAIVLSDGAIPKMGSDCKLTTLNDAKLSPDFLEIRNHRLNSTMFSKEDWKIANNSNLCAADRVLAGAEIMQLESIRSCSEVCDKTRKCQMDSTRRLGDRLKDTSYWKNELQKEMDKLHGGIKQLESLDKCISMALKGTEEPLQILIKCLKERKNRRDIDLVDDDVDYELRKAIDSIEKVQNHLKSHSTMIQSQLGKINGFLKRLSNNISNKFVTLKVDDSCRKLTNTSKLPNSLEASDPCIKAMDDWLEESCNLIQSGLELEAENARLHGQGCEFLSSCTETMNGSWQGVKQALSLRISEYLNAKNKLESQLKKILKDLIDAQKMTEYIKKNIKDLEKPLLVAQARVSLRSKRAPSEDCYDSAHEKLSKETFQIGLSAEELEAKLRGSEFMEQELGRSKRGLEHDMQLKCNSLHIDRNVCLGLMNGYDMSSVFSCLKLHL